MSHESGTHETFIQAVRVLATARITDESERQKLADCKMVYGVGAMRGARGITFYGAWQNGTTHDFIEVAASGEESPIQLAGTTVHELAHILAGWGAGHGAPWKAAAARLGLVTAEAGGQAYTPEHFEPALWSAIQMIPQPTDGTPQFKSQLGGNGLAGGLPLAKPRPCPMGIGTRGGKSRGLGSGSRLRLWICACVPAVRVRIASDGFKAHCDRCSAPFARA